MKKKRIGIQCLGRNLHRNSLPKGSVSLLHYSSPMADTEGGKVSLGAISPLLVFSPPEAKSEILAFSRDS